MPWTPADIDALKSALVRGVLTVTHSGESVTYQSMSDMRELLAEMEREVAAASGSTTAQSYRLAVTSKGLG